MIAVLLFLLALAATGFGRGPIAHPAKGEPYHRVNSIRGIRRARRRGYRRIDLDLSITADGVIVINHWPRLMVRDGFRDPAGKVARNTPISKLAWAVVARLRTVVGNFRVITLERALKVCAEVGIQPVLEPKGDPRFEQAATWAKIHRLNEAAGSDAAVRVLAKNNPHGTVLRYARVWFPAWEI